MGASSKADARAKLGQYQNVTKQRKEKIMARKDTVDINASGKKITIKDVRATNMRNDPSEEIKKPKDYAKDVVGMFKDMRRFTKRV